jgi:2-oxo-4-hydroxy-4-carboxy-5-ureidoimidazoline decarboxylase
VTLAELNRLTRPQFEAELGGIFEHSPWVASDAYAARPFSGLESLHAAMMEAVLHAPQEKQLALIRAHPELAGAEAKGCTLTPHSSSEQARLGLDALSGEQFTRIGMLNRRYREKFGFPCIIALRLHVTRESVLAQMERRLANDRDAEMRNALAQIGHIARGRLAKLLGES